MNAALKMMNGDVENGNAQIALWYEQWQSLLLNEGMRFGYSAEEIKDLLHQFFLDLIEKKINTAQIQSPKAYLVTAFKRRLIDYYHSRRKSITVHEAAFPQAHSSYDPEYNVLEIDQQHQLLVQSVRKAYEQLPKRCKKVIYLKFNEGKTTDEIATITGLSKRSVYNNLFEGIQRLRASMQNSGQGLNSADFLVLLPIFFANFF